MSIISLLQSLLYNQKNTHLEQKKIKCDVGMMIDHDVAEKRYENKVGMSS